MHQSPAIFDTDTDPNYMIVIYICICICGMIGNIVTCVVIASNVSMHTVTNCYLFNLAISDIIFLIFGYPPLNGYPRFTNEILCTIRGLLAEGSVYVSVLTISVFSIERYLAICHPFLTRTLSQMSRSSRTLPVIWLLSLLCAIPLTTQIGVMPHQDIPEYAMCTFDSWLAHRIVEIVTVVFFVLPMILMGYLYTLIAMKLRNPDQVARKTECGTGNDEAIQDRNTNRVMRILVAVVVAFFICWAPFHLQRLITVYFFDWFNDDAAEVHTTLTNIASALSYSSGMINPLLYSIMSNKFRKALKSTLKRSWASMQP